MEQMIGSTLAILTKQTMGRVGRRTSTKQRSTTVVGAQFLPRNPGKGEHRQQFPADRVPIATLWAHYPAARARETGGTLPRDISAQNCW